MEAVKTLYSNLDQLDGGRSRTPKHAPETSPQLEGRARGAWLRSLGVRRLPSWDVCRRVCATSGEADELFAALALADGLPPEHTTELLRRASPCGARAAAVLSATQRRQADVLTPERIAAYIAAHPFARELELKAENYQCSEQRAREIVAQQLGIAEDELTEFDEVIRRERL